MSGVSKATMIGEVVLPGLLIVFLALIILILSIWAMGKVMEAVGGKAKSKKPSQASAPAAPPQPLPTGAQGGIPEETVAVISAAVAAVMEESAPGLSYAITGVRRAGDSRPVWGFAGMQQNTRPF